jgi:hypothetical protein
MCILEPLQALTSLNTPNLQIGEKKQLNMALQFFSHQIVMTGETMTQRFKKLVSHMY